MFLPFCLPLRDCTAETCSIPHAIRSSSETWQGIFFFWAIYCNGFHHLFRAGMCILLKEIVYQYSLQAYCEDNRDIRNDSVSVAYIVSSGRKAFIDSIPGRFSCSNIKECFFPKECQFFWQKKKGAIPIPPPQERRSTAIRTQGFETCSKEVL